MPSVGGVPSWVARARCLAVRPNLVAIKHTAVIMGAAGGLLDKDLGWVPRDALLGRQIGLQFLVGSTGMQ